MTTTREQAVEFENQGISRDCLDCGLHLSLKNFTYQNVGKWGHLARCRDCDNQRKRDWRKANPERARKWDKDAAVKHAESRKKNQARWYQDNKDEIAVARREADYGISQEQYEAMYVEQEGKCWICRATLDPSSRGRKNRKDAACVDHCHETGKIRGLLCTDCNRGIGLFKDNRLALNRAIEYLDPNRRPLIDVIAPDRKRGAYQYK